MRNDISLQSCLGNSLIALLLLRETILSSLQLSRPSSLHSPTFCYIHAPKLYRNNKSSARLVYLTSVQENGNTQLSVPILPAPNTYHLADYFDSTDLPSVKPSAIALGTAFNHGISLAVLAPIFGETYRRGRAADTKEEFLRSKEAASAAAAWGSSLTGSALQAYGVGALINATGTLSQKGYVCCSHRMVLQKAQIANVAIELHTWVL